jgi:pimeloyl-ACP methyl ester carboxylesterase
MLATWSPIGRIILIRAQEAALNEFSQFKVSLHDIDVHYLDVRGAGPNPYPLLLLHGWPGSVYEFLDMIPRLTDPARFGGDPKDAFSVIAPSLPGYGLSFKPGQKRFILQELRHACMIS